MTRLYEDADDAAVRAAYARWKIAQRWDTPLEYHDTLDLSLDAFLRGAEPTHEETDDDER